MGILDGSDNFPARNFAQFGLEEEMVRDAENVLRLDETIRKYGAQREALSREVDELNSQIADLEKKEDDLEIAAKLAVNPNIGDGEEVDEKEEYQQAIKQIKTQVAELEKKLNEKNNKLAEVNMEMQYAQRQRSRIFADIKERGAAKA